MSHGEHSTSEVEQKNEKNTNKSKSHINYKPGHNTVPFLIPFKIYIIVVFNMIQQNTQCSKLALTIVVVSKQTNTLRNICCRHK